MLLTAQQVALRLQVSEATLRQWRKRGKGPPWEPLGDRLVRYDAAAVDAWARAQRGPGDAA